MNRALRQMDRSAWCVRDHFSSLAQLAVPTLVLAAAIVVLIGLAARQSSVSEVFGFVMFTFVIPFLALTTFCLAPLPCAVFAWHTARGESTTPAACWRICWAKSGRLLYIGFHLTWRYLIWSIFLWLPMLVFWPRTCLVPNVALFEEDRDIFRRSRRLLHEEVAINMMAGLYFLLAVVLAAIIVAPRVLIASQLVKTAWAERLEQDLWAFELVMGTLLFCAVAVSWCVAITLLYYDIRQHREGDWLRARIDELNGAYRQREEPNA